MVNFESSVWINTCDEYHGRENIKIDFSLQINQSDSQILSRDFFDEENLIIS